MAPSYPLHLLLHKESQEPPLSADVMEPTCFEPFGANIFLGFCTVVTPVSSTFQMREKENLYLSNTSDNLEKKLLTLVLLNDVALLRLVASGVLIDKDWLRFKKRCQPINSCFFIIMPRLRHNNIVLKCTSKC